MQFRSQRPGLPVCAAPAVPPDVRRWLCPAGVKSFISPAGLPSGAQPNVLETVPAAGHSHRLTSGGTAVAAILMKLNQ